MSSHSFPNPSLDDDLPSSHRDSNVSLPMSPYRTSPWSSHTNPFLVSSSASLVASLLRHDGHIYSLAASRNLLFTGSDSKNIRVWRNLSDFSGFKSSSGLVKAILLLPSSAHVFTGHQDGKIRVWKPSPKNPKSYSRVASLPRLKDYFSGRRRHKDAVSCLALDESNAWLFSGSWDRSLKLWRVSDLRLMDSVRAHEDAVNSVVVGFDGLVFSGSADGTVRVWRVEMKGKSRRVVEVEVLVREETAVTALAVSLGAGVLYCGGSDGRVSVWGRDLGREGVLEGHKCAVLCVAVGGEMVFTGSADKAICVWGREGEGRGHVWLSVLTGHEGPVKCLAVEEDGDGEGRGWVVYSGSMDKSVKVWKVRDFVGWKRELLGGSSVDDPIFDAF